MIHCFPVKGKYLRMIAEGKKTIEVHIYKRYFKNFKVGDILLMFDGRANIIRARIKDIRIYDSLRELLEKEDPNKIIHGMSKEEILKEFSKIYKISESALLRKKMIAIELELIDFIPAPKRE